MATLADFDALWDYSKPAESEQRFRRLLTGSAAFTDLPGRAWRAELLSQLARTLGLQRRFDEANQVLDQAEALLEDGQLRARARCLLERGRVLNTSGDPASSRALFLSAEELAREAGADFFVVDALHMLGIVDAPERRLDWDERAIQVAASSSDPRARNWAASLYNNYGWAKMDLGRFEEALEAFQHTLPLREAQGKPEGVRVARWCIARALRALGRLEEALTMQQDLQAEFARENGADGYVFEELGEIYLEMARPTEAKPHFAAAFRLLSQDEWLAEQEPSRLARLKSLSES